MDHLGAMRAFVETVRRRSLAAAAGELGLSRSLVTRQLQALEDRLETRLMHRTTRAITLTRAGERYFDLCDDILTRMAALEAEITQDAQEEAGEVSILVPVWLSQQVTEVAVAFVQSHPAIRPRLLVGGAAPTAYDFLDRGCDLAFFPRRPPDSRIVARSLGEIRHILCAAPDYLSRHGAPSGPEEIARFDALHHVDHPLWDLSRGPERVSVALSPVLSADTHLVLHQAARRGLGLAILPQSLIAEDLAAGRLVALLPDWRVGAETLFIASAPGGGMPVRVRRFIDFACAAFRGGR